MIFRKGEKGRDATHTRDLITPTSASRNRADNDKAKRTFLSACLLHRLRGRLWAFVGVRTTSPNKEGGGRFVGVCGRSRASVQPHPTRNETLTKHDDAKRGQRSEVRRDLLTSRRFTIAEAIKAFRGSFAYEYRPS